MHPGPSRPGKCPSCPAPEHPQLITLVTREAPRACTGGDGDGGVPGRSSHGQASHRVVALDSVPARRQPWGRNQRREGGAGGRNWSHWEKDRSRHVPSTGCPSAPVPPGHGHSCPLAVLSPGPWAPHPLSTSSPVPCSPVTLSHGQSCPCGPQAPLSPRLSHPLSPRGSPPLPREGPSHQLSPG